ncbi:MAG: D-glycero-beta-D-manno-heptose-7-phosphate kinase [Treponemataceae bacterium]
MNKLDAAQLRNKILSIQTNVNILVFGDILLDEYIFGSVNRISPEAPVPILNVNSEKFVLGGAANVAANLIALGANALLCGVCGKDAQQERLFRLLEIASVKNYILQNKSKPTITKSRIVADNQQMMRVDREDTSPLSMHVEQQLTSVIDTIFEQNTIDVILISDYNKGTCTQSLCTHLIQKAKKQNIMVLVDPKGSDWTKYSHTDFITPNLKELSDITQTAIKNDDLCIANYAQKVMQDFNIKNLLVTRSEKGMSLFEGKSTFTIKTQAKEVFDVCGAGDTVISTLAYFIGLKQFTQIECVQLANLAAGISVAHFGTYAVSLAEILHELPSENSKIISVQNLSSLVQRLKKSQKKIIFTNGCFDILHIGHVRYLSQARSLGDILIIGLNSDNSVKRLKGENRPINNEQIRCEMLSYLPFVDYVVVFEEDTPLEIIKMIEPHILVKGGDYKIEDIVGREFAQEVQTISFVEGFSTTNLLEKSRQNET